MSGDDHYLGDAGRGALLAVAVSALIWLAGAAFVYSLVV